MQTLKHSLSVILTLALMLACLAGVTGGALASELKFEQVIAPQFEEVKEFSEGLAAAKKGGKWGYIDETGKTVFDFKFDYAYSFNEGYAVVVVGGQTEVGVFEYEYTFIDHSGKRTPFLAPVFDDSMNITGYSVMHVNTAFDSVDEFETFLSQEQSCFVNGYVSLHYCMDIGLEETDLLFDTTGQLVDKYYNAFLDEGYEGQTKFDSNQLYLCAPAGVMGDNGYIAYMGGRMGFGGYVSVRDGRKITVPEIDNRYVSEALPFNQGVAGVFLGSWENDTTLFGVINETGSWAIQPVYTKCWHDLLSGEIFSSEAGIASVANDKGLFGGIDKTGKTVIPFEYSDLQRFYEGKAAFCKDGKYGYMDASANVVIQAQFDAATGFNNGCALVLKNGAPVLIDTKGDVISGSDKIDLASYMFTDSSGEKNVSMPDEYAIICENGKYGFAHISLMSDKPADTEIPAWALPEVTAAIEKGLVPASLQNQYSANITRAEFASLAVALVEAKEGKDIESVVLAKTGKPLSDYISALPFTDTTDNDVIASYALELVNGTGNGKYSPSASITRQDSATLLTRLAKFCGKTEGGAPLSFADSAAISDYAAAGVNFVSSLGIMNGTGSNMFSPKDTYTRQQAYITMSRLLNALDAK